MEVIGGMMENTPFVPLSVQERVGYWDVSRFLRRQREKWERQIREGSSPKKQYVRCPKRESVIGLEKMMKTPFEILLPYQRDIFKDNSRFVVVLASR